MQTEKKVIGKCPVCGGDVMESPLGFCCNGTTKEGRRCQFVIHHQIHGVEMTEEICRTSSGVTICPEMFRQILKWQEWTGFLKLLQL